MDHSLEEEFIEETLGSTDQNSREVSKNRKWLGRFIWIYAILVTIFLIRYVRTEYFGTKNIDVRLNATMTGLVTYDKHTKEIVEMSYDRNFDNNIELVESFYPNLKVSAQMHDYNEDGFLEKTVYFDQNGNESGYAIDDDLDNYLERFSFILENGEILNLIDLDKNGKYEIE